MVLVRTMKAIIAGMKTAGADVDGGEVDLSALPEGCIANILSFTTPLDACRLSLVSSVFSSAAQSDAVWESFLPFEYQAIISSSPSPLPAPFLSKKNAYIHLCENPILIDGGTKSFSLDKNSGKKCYMLSARDLSIAWGDTPRYWKWISPPGSRFTELAELISVCWLEIRGNINTGILSPFTLYGAYLVFKPATTAYGFQDRPVDVAVRLVGTESNTKSVYLDTERECDPIIQLMPMRLGLITPPPTRSSRNSLVHKSRSSERSEDRFPTDRKDGWMEIELGEFFNKKDDEELEMSVQEVKSGSWKGGLIVQGIEIRPKTGK